MAPGHAVSLIVAGVAIGRGFHRFARYPRLIHVAVAVNTPTHAEILDLSYPFHCLDRPVTSLALDPGVHVRAVIEVNEIGELVNPDPGYWISWPAWVGLHFFIEAHRFIQFRKFRRNNAAGLSLLAIRLFAFGSDCPPRRFDYPVAIHAYADRRDARMTAFFRSEMAVQATDLKFPGM
jgi:hypothetical protein